MCIFFEIPRTISNFITTLVAFLLLVLSLPSAAKRRSSGEPGARRGFPTRGLAVSNLRRLFYLYLDTMQGIERRQSSLREKALYPALLVSNKSTYMVSLGTPA
uniref:Uncharacterized protein n=1 Tax=Oryza punctata TaxID=4537 RepID=A0A0E0LER7_ORYPU